jgi:hypothetical protein
MRLMLSSTRRNGKGPWVAKITGTDPQYGLARRFLRGQQLGTLVVFDIDPGRHYEVFEPILARRRFVTCSIYDIEPRTVSYGDVMRIIDLERIDDDWEPAVRRAIPPPKSLATLAYDDLSDL